MCEFVCARWNASSMFREEIGACVAIQTRYVMDACECAIHNSFVSYGGDVIHACWANKTECH